LQKQNTRLLLLRKYILGIFYSEGLNRTQSLNYLVINISLQTNINIVNHKYVSEDNEQIKSTNVFS
jgi:hypothetical protein